MCLHAHTRAPHLAGVRLDLSQILVLERYRADAFPRRGVNRIKHRGRGDEDSRLANATPEAARWHDYRLDLRHRFHAHDLIGVEILLLDAAILDRALAIEKGGESKGE